MEEKGYFIRSVYTDLSWHQIPVSSAKNVLFMV